MAKDKSEKKAKADKPEKATKSGFAKPSEAPAGGDSWNLTEEGEGKLLLMTPTGTTSVDTNDYGAKEVVIADVVLVNTKNPAKSELHEDVYIFGGYLKGALKGFIGQQKVLGRLAKVEDKKAGRGFHWEFADADADDIEAATEYINSVDVFKVKK